MAARTGNGSGRAKPRGQQRAGTRGESGHGRGARGRALSEAHDELISDIRTLESGLAASRGMWARASIGRRQAGTRAADVYRQTYVAALRANRAVGNRSKGGARTSPGGSRADFVGFS